jgi:hypothetical protein
MELRWGIYKEKKPRILDGIGVGEHWSFERRLVRRSN